MLPCQSCNQGDLIPTQVPRTSTLGMIIGVLLFIPALCGIPIGALLIYVVHSASQNPQPDITRNYASQRLEDDDVPSEISDRVLSEKPIPAAELQHLTPTQKRTISDMQYRLIGARLGQGIGYGIVYGVAIGIILTAFATFLFGGLLISKENILQCSHCAAIFSPAPPSAP